MARIKKLTTRQQNFIALLPKHNWIGTLAVLDKDSGYRAKNSDVASVIASELLKKTLVLEAVERLKEQRLKKIGVESERILQEVAKVAFVDISKILNDKGAVKDPEDWPEELRGAISSLEQFEEFAGSGGDRELIGYTKKVKTYDKVECLKLLMQYLKMVGNNKHSGTNVNVIILEAGPISKPGDSGMSSNARAIDITVSESE